MYRIFVIIGFLIWNNQLQAQSIYRDIVQNKITLNKDDSKQVFFITDKGYRKAVDLEKYYYWYQSGRLNVSQGAYSGKLLDGEYTVFYGNKNMEEKGSFEKGLKTGLWKKWYPNGQLKEVFFWRKGRKNGEFREYTEAGLLSRKGIMKNGAFNRTLLSYYYTGENLDSTFVQQYRKGKLQPAKERKTSKESRLSKIGNSVAHSLERLRFWKKEKSN